MGRKHCGKRRNCSLRAVFSKGLFPRGVKRRHCVGMGYVGGYIGVGSSISLSVCLSLNECEPCTLYQVSHHSYGTRSIKSSIGLQLTESRPTIKNQDQPCSSDLKKIYVSLCRVCIQT